MAAASPDPLAGAHGVVESLINAVLSNSATSMVALMMLNIIVVLGISNYVIKLVLSMGKEQINNLMKQLDSKEKELERMNQKFQEMMTRFLKLQEDSVESHRSLEMFMTELRTRLTMANTNTRPSSRTRDRQ